MAAQLVQYRAAVAVRFRKGGIPLDRTIKAGEGDGGISAPRERNAFLVQSGCTLVAGCDFLQARHGVGDLFGGRHCRLGAVDDYTVRRGSQNVL